MNWGVKEVAEFLEGRVVHRQVLMQQSSPRQMGVDIMVRNHHAELLATCSELPELDESIGGVMCSLSCLR
jgi:hypothetical protein